jgi:lipid-A-disaccharide synthase
MVATLDLLLTIYPFEVDCFSGTSLLVKYVGNPLLNTIESYEYSEEWKSEVGIAGKYISLFPGSRISEIRHNLPKQLKAIEKLRGFEFGLSVVRESQIPFIEKLIKESSLKLGKDIFLVPKFFSYELMRDSYAAIATSGTVTLELAFHSIPTVVVYHVTTLNYLIVTFLFRLNLPHYCIVNILMNKTVFPELMHKDFSEEKLFYYLNELCSDSNRHTTVVEQCSELRKQLYVEDAALNSARAIGEQLS